MPEFHAKISPSSFKRLRQCPGSLRYVSALRQQGKLKADTSSEAAENGTAQHEVIEMALDGMQIEAPYTAENGVELDVDQVAAAYEVVDWIRIQKFDKLWNEMRVPVGKALRLNDPDLCWGTSDVIGYLAEEKALYVIDAKMGFMAVEPEANDQALLYSVGALEALTDLPVDHVYNVIIQPKAGGVKIAPALTLDQLDDYKIDARQVIAASNQTDAPLIPGEDQCRFCPASGQCRAQIDDDFEDLDHVEAGVLSGEEIGHWLTRAAHLKSTLAAIAAEALRRMEIGDAIPGWVREAGQSRATWIDEDEVIFAIEDAGLDVDIYAPRKPATQTALKKAMGKAKVEALVHRKPGQPKLTPADKAKNPLDADFEVL
jgi:hypothetical protein